ncbi:MAG: CoA transferase, partial [Comamonadaceae bacterium]
MPGIDQTSAADLPLAGCRVVECSHSVAAAYAGKLLAAMGAQVLMLEPPGGSPLRQAPPWLDGSEGSDGRGESALFAYLAVGKRSAVCDAATDEGRQRLLRELETADILIDDMPVAERGPCGLDSAVLAVRFPDLVHVSVLPFGASGPKAHWRAEEVNLLHAGGEGFLIPNGLS